MKILNARKTAQKHPGTFEVPSFRELAQIKPGDYIKATFTSPGGPAERLWFSVERVISCRNGRLWLDCLLVSDPICFGFDVGSRHRIESKCVTSVERSPVPQAEVAA